MDKSEIFHVMSHPVRKNEEWFEQILLGKQLSDLYVENEIYPVEVSGFVKTPCWL